MNGCMNCWECNATDSGEGFPCLLCAFDEFSGPANAGLGFLLFLVTPRLGLGLLDGGNSNNFGSSPYAIESLGVDSVQSRVKVDDGSAIATATTEAMPDSNAVWFLCGMEVLLFASMDRAGGREVFIVCEVEITTNGTEIFRQAGLQQIKIVIHGNLIDCALPSGENLLL
jgi:hypothetical protein